ncbi:hypothetical protein PsorP6_003569 [Peronosclerospora sorghi]|uniref:Uncharacterized protein n=1 Tax=Peronosclerospora sorghi TaxID=230839 RepID=A0ACC0VMM4_9STRA|nr:hypothetical protein PsorP6_003569 [Peronosclerospora sorghi]
MAAAPSHFLDMPQAQEMARMWSNAPYGHFKGCISIRYNDGWQLPVVKQCTQILQCPHVVGSILFAQK